MRNVREERTLTAPRSSVWAVLADYPNISVWNEAMTNSYALGDTIEG
ncbi:MAG: SRPBCC family protein, partial [Actinomycetia bacterium]|nr:SRPBCC family protein [Actinomycetes bacterium]